MYFMYGVTVSRPDSDEEFFRGIVDANNTEHAKEKITNVMKDMLASTTGEVSDDQLDIVITKLRDAINNTENGMICISHCNERTGIVKSDDTADNKRDIDSPSVYAETMYDGTFTIRSAGTGVVRKVNDIITGLTDVEAAAVMDDMNFIINHLPDDKNNVAVTGALAALSIDFLEAALLKNLYLYISDDDVNRNLRMLDRRLASLYHTAGKVTGKPIRPVGYFYCSNDMVNAFVDTIEPGKEVFIRNESETLAPQIQFPIDSEPQRIINNITMSEYEDSLMDAFDEINRFLMPITEPTAELSACADSDKLNELTQRINKLGTLIVDHAREFDTVYVKMKKLKKQIKALKKGRC